MNLLLVWHAGGISSYTKRVEELSRNFHQVLLIIPEEWKEGGKVIKGSYAKISDNCEIKTIKTYLNIHASTYLFNMKKLNQYVKDFKPNIIHIHEEPWCLSAYQVIFSTRLLKNPHIIIDSAVINDKKKPIPFNLIEKKVYKNSSLFFARNQKVKESLEARGCISPIYLLPNGVDTELFKEIDYKSNKLKDTELSAFINESMVLAYVGRMIEEKGIYDFVQAAKILVNKYKVDCKFVMIGSGDELSEIKDLIAELEMEEHFYVNDKISSSTVPDLMNLINILVLPSRTQSNWEEQFGRVLVEAMCCRKVVIGSSSGAIPDVISNDNCIFKEGEEEELAFIANRLIKDSDLYKSIADDNYHKAVNAYSWRYLAEYYKTTLSKEGIDDHIH
ncbi:glycosyltransferase family 4 protein [Alkalicoccobacillus porphyridii]|uniref:Glycosyltransferase family 4 protein n=1 Tax=Alkalicoccobacillus porphyridii TaxID=2597270 RepID=A0A554A4D7_9BACI|nr:glycosyltransferase family 4 protein [Alkalicoccobacillus porphyridii]TSB48535.1 glycosyltransferase family 4 protein [Alkalicoccobacillus porphyridii]